MSASAIILTPLSVTAGMIAAGTTIAAVDATQGEAAWAAGTAYAVGQRVNHAGAIWEAVAASTGATPGQAPDKWLRYGPSNRMAPFDDEFTTRAVATGSLTYVLRPGFFTGLALWGLQGDHLTINIYDAPGGAVVESYDADLYEQATGLYDLLFLPLRQRTKHYMQNLPLYPDAEVRITLSASGGAQVAIGLITVGHWDTLIGAGDFGGVEYGATAEVKSYSYIKRADDGTVTRLRRGGATNIDCSVVIDAAEANRAMDLLHQVQGRPIAFIASGLPRYDYLSGFGDLSGSATPQSYAHAILKLRIEGVVQ